MDRMLPKYLLQDNSATAVVFIHGLGGSYSTWKEFTKTLNREWKESDAFNLEYDDYYNNVKNFPIYTFLSKSFFGKSIEKLSEHLNSFIKTICDSYENVILVCHSMGGLIARKYLIDLLNKDRSLGKIKALITYATPHLGSSLANIFGLIVQKPLSVFEFGSLRLLSQVKDLSKNSELIKSINKDWSNLGISSKIDFIRVIGSADKVVSENSAKYESNDDKNVFCCANKDHFNIIKPHPFIKDNALFVTYNYLKKFKSKLEEENESLEEYTDDNDMDF